MSYGEDMESAFGHSLKTQCVVMIGVADNQMRVCKHQVVLRAAGKKEHTVQWLISPIFETVNQAHLAYHLVEPHLNVYYLVPCTTLRL